MNHQVALHTGNSEPLLRFCVKFYTPDPAQVEEEYTRYTHTVIFNFNTVTLWCVLLVLVYMCGLTDQLAEEV